MKSRFQVRRGRRGRVAELHGGGCARRPASSAVSPAAGGEGAGAEYRSDLGLGAQRTIVRLGEIVAHHIGSAR